MKIANKFTKTELRKMQSGFSKAGVEEFYYNDDIARYAIFVKCGRKADSIWIVDSYDAWETEYLDIWNNVTSDGYGRIEPENPDYKVVKIVKL